MEEENQQLLQSLVYKNTTCSAVNSSSSTSTAHNALEVKLLDDNFISNIKLISSNSGIILRIMFIIFIGVVSIWANYEASKSFEITIVNEAGDTPSGKRFALFYVSNDKVTRLVISTSKFVEDILYPNESYPKKQVNHVTIRLASRNLTDAVIVESPKDHQFVLHVSPSVMEEIDFSHAMFLAVQQGMARIWLWDGHGNAPPSLVNGMVKYISNLAVLNKMSSTSGDVALPLCKTFCWNDKDPRALAQFLNYCEQHKQGFIRRLNQAMKDGWEDQMLDDALGMQAQHLCVETETHNQI